jgi:hypothetical protein
MGGWDHPVGTRAHFIHHGWHMCRWPGPCLEQMMMLAAVSVGVQEPRGGLS